MAKMGLAEGVRWHCVRFVYHLPLVEDLFLFWTRTRLLSRTVSFLVLVPCRAQSIPPEPERPRAASSDLASENPHHRQTNLQATLLPQVITTDTAGLYCTATATSSPVAE
jgi:hypothetical protein